MMLLTCPSTSTFNRYLYSNKLVNFKGSGTNLGSFWN